MLSIIVPTYNEAGNIPLLHRRIAQSLDTIEYELVFVDDSTDETPAVLDKLAQTDPRVRFLHRDKGRGLASAVAEGLKIARGDCLAVMDADLQHPPELLVRMKQVIESGADVVVPSRFIPGGSDGGLKAYRKLISAIARRLGQVMLKKLAGVTDPTGGFFMLRRGVLAGVSLNPVGWKILIEILIKGKYKRVVEVPYSFAARENNSSKMCLREQLNYLHHLVRLVYISPLDKKFWQQALRESVAMVVSILLFGFIHGLIPPLWVALLASLAYVPANRLMNISSGGRRYPYAPARMAFSLSLAVLTSGIGGLLMLFFLLSSLGVPVGFAFLIAATARTCLMLASAEGERQRKWIEHEEKRVQTGY